MSASVAHPEESIPSADRWELLRALGAFALCPPPGIEAVCRGLDLAEPSGAEHTAVFVLSLPPHAGIHLGAEGQLGGEGLDRVAGFWRALSLRPPEDADHIGTLLMLYAELGSAESSATDQRRAGHLRRARTALLHEHLWSWVPGYLAAVRSVHIPSTTAWAELTYEALLAEVADSAAPVLLPLALRVAPAGVSTDDTLADVLDALVTPIRSGLILTQQDLRRAAATVGVGFRRGERRFALKAMLEQDPELTLRWLVEHAQTWIDVHSDLGAGPSGAWWQARAAHTARVLEQFPSAARPAAGGDRP